MPDTIPIIVNGVVAQDTPAQIQAAFPGATVTPTANFDFPWNGDEINFFAGMSQEVTPDLLAALTAAGAPFTQP